VGLEEQQQEAQLLQSQAEGSAEPLILTGEAFPPLLATHPLWW
jgi:hypothetical protein